MIPTVLKLMYTAIWDFLGIAHSANLFIYFDSLAFLAHVFRNFLEDPKERYSPTLTLNEGMKPYHSTKSLEFSSFSHFFLTIFPFWIYTDSVAAATSTILSDFYFQETI